MRQVAAHAQVQPEDLIAGLKDRQHQCRICLRAAMGLHVRIRAPENLFQPVNCQLLDLVHDLTAAIISPAGISLRIFIGQHGTHRLHDLEGGKVLRSDQFYSMTLTFQLLSDQFKNNRIFLHGANLDKNALFYTRLDNLHESDHAGSWRWNQTTSAYVYTTQGFDPTCGKNNTLYYRRPAYGGRNQRIYLYCRLPGRKDTGLCPPEISAADRAFCVSERTSGHRPC